MAMWTESINNLNNPKAPLDTPTHMDQFFQSDPIQPTTTQPTPSSSQQYQDQQFDFTNVNTLPTSNNNFAEAEDAPSDDILRKIREDQQRIQQLLREKSNKQYEEKQKRRQAGQQQLEDFMNRKASETEQRKRDNAERERQRGQQQQGSGEEGWKKVAANVQLKQGETSIKKDITRMRQSIINKKNDEIH